MAGSWFFSPFSDFRVSRYVGNLLKRISPPSLLTAVIRKPVKNVFIFVYACVSVCRPWCALWRSEVNLSRVGSLLLPCGV